MRIALFATCLADALFPAAAIATDDQAALGVRVRHGRWVNHGLVVEKFFLLRGHEAAIQPEHATTARRVQQLQRLVGRVAIGINLMMTSIAGLPLIFRR